MESIFKRLQIGDAVSIHNCFKEKQLHCCLYKGANYEQIQGFCQVKDPGMTCGALVGPLSKCYELICESHVVLGSIVDHTVPLRQGKKHRFGIISFEDIIDVCLYMK